MNRQILPVDFGFAFDLTAGGGLAVLGQKAG
jgi:hypothetical protein